MKKNKSFFKKYKNLLAGLALAVICTVAYDPFRLENTSGDNISNRYWPVAILKYHTFYLTPFNEELRTVMYAAIYNGPVWYPRSDLGIIVTSLPFFWAADVFGWIDSEWTHDKINRISRWNGIFLATGATIGLFLLFLKYASLPVSFLSALLFALTTWNWSLGAQGLSPQVAAVFFHVIGFHLLWLISQDKKKRHLIILGIALGLVHGLIWDIRPSDLYLWAPSFLIIWQSRLIIVYLCSFFAVTLPQIYFYIVYYGHWMGWRGYLSSMYQVKAYDPAKILEGFPGVLFSPNRGAIVFFPLLFLIPYFWYKFIPSLPIKSILGKALLLKLPTLKNSLILGIPESVGVVMALGSIAYFISLCCIPFWHCTWSYGVRYLYDFQAYLWIVVPFVLKEIWKWYKGKKLFLPRWALGLFIWCLIQGAGIHWLGHNNFDIYVWNSKSDEDESIKAWRFDDLMIVDTWRAGSNANRWNNALERLLQYGF